MIKQQLRRAALPVKNIKARWQPYLTRLARDAGLLEGTVEYTPFIVLGRSRVGSNFLRSLLNSHSQIVAFGEIFGNHDHLNWDVKGYPPSKNALALLQKRPLRFLERDVFRKFPPYVAAVGFKIFYYHAQNDNWQPIWTYLKHKKDLKIIHLKRENILKTHLSRKKAVLTDVWVNMTGVKQPDAPIFLDYEECLKEFERTRQWEEQFDLFFEDHHRLEVLYEGLAGANAPEMKRIQAFLEVDYEAVAPSIYKQSRQHLSQAITNYADLKEKFTGSPWEMFFEG